MMSSITVIKPKANVTERETVVKKLLKNCDTLKKKLQGEKV